MKPPERRQLHDEIVAGTVKIEDVPMKKLDDFWHDFSEDYAPDEDFFWTVCREKERRLSVPRKQARIKSDFFG